MSGGQMTPDAPKGNGEAQARQPASPEMPGAERPRAPRQRAAAFINRLGAVRGLRALLAHHVEEGAQRANESQGQDSERRAAAVADRLRRFIDETKLARNTQHYEELQRELTEEEQRQVGLIRDVLLEVPLVHATRRNDADTTSPLLPASEIPDPSHTNTDTLDRDLGLDEYTFFHWGFPRPYGQYGRIFMLVDPHLLLDERAVVTPQDILGSASLMESTFDQLPRDRQRNVRQHYFDQMLTGERWLELMARRILFAYQQAKQEGRPFLFVEGENTDMGEIKFHGTVPVDRIIKRVDLLKTAEQTDETPGGSIGEHWKWLYEHGFGYSAMEAHRREMQTTGQKAGQTPEDIGVDYMRATHFWESVLEPQQPVSTASSSS